MCTCRYDLKKNQGHFSIEAISIVFVGQNDRLTGQKVIGEHGTQAESSTLRVQVKEMPVGRRVQDVT